MPIDKAIYTGIRDWSGQMPPTIMNNGKLNRDKENVYMNNMSYNLYLWRLLDIAMSVFEWKNLPKGVDPRMLEMWLCINGFCAFFYDEDLKSDWRAGNAAPEGYAVLQCFINGQWDIYNYPLERTAYATNGINVQLNEENSVIIYNDYLRVPMFNTIQMYAYRLAEIDRTIDINVRNQKTPKVIRCDESQKLTFQQIQQQVDGNNYWVATTKDLDLKNLDVLDLSAPYVGNDLQILKHQYWNEALTYLGVENVTTEKKERLISNEVMSNMGDVEAQRFTRLNARKWACTQINELFDLDVDCDFRSGIYIKADGYGSQNIATTGMKDSTVLTQQGTGYEQKEDTVGIVAKIRELLGM